MKFCDERRANRITRMVIISDTHNMLADMSIPDGDILIHAGDLTDLGSLDELERANTELGKLGSSGNRVRPDQSHL